MIERNDVIKRPAYRSAAANGGGERTLLLLAAARIAADNEARRRAEEDAALDAKNVLEQAEEANALDPVG